MKKTIENAISDGVLESPGFRIKTCRNIQFETSVVVRLAVGLPLCMVTESLGPSWAVPGEHLPSAQAAHPWPKIIVSNLVVLLKNV